MIKQKTLKKKSEEIGINGLNSISKLEADIMKIIWDKKTSTVREVHEIIIKKQIGEKSNNFTPYTTIMSTMTTLAEKGLLKQNKTAKTYSYQAIINRKDLIKSIIKSLSENLINENFSNLIIKFLSNPGNIALEDLKKIQNEIDKY